MKSLDQWAWWMSDSMRGFGKKQLAIRNTSKSMWTLIKPNPFHSISWSSITFAEKTHLYISSIYQLFWGLWTIAISNSSRQHPARLNSLVPTWCRHVTPGLGTFARPPAACFPLVAAGKLSQCPNNNLWWHSISCPNHSGIPSGKLI